MKRFWMAVLLVLSMLWGGAALSLPAIASSSTSKTPAQDSRYKPSNLSVHQLFEKVQAALGGLDDADLIVEMETFNPEKNSSSIMRASVQLLRNPDILRMTYLKPEAFLDQVMIFDRKDNMAHIYFPVTNQIVVQDLSSMLKREGLNPDIDKLLALPSEDNFYINLLGRETVDGVDYYVLSLKPKNVAVESAAPGNQKQPDGTTFDKVQEMALESTELVWVDPRTWLVTKLELKDGLKRTTMIIRLLDLKLNVGLTRDELLELPMDATILRQ